MSIYTIRKQKTNTNVVTFLEDLVKTEEYLFHITDERGYMVFSKKVK